MEKSKISPRQLFSLMVLFEMGSAIVVGLGMQAKQDAWLSILLGMIGGLFLFLIYGYLFNTYPNLALTGYLVKILGKYIGKIFALLYIAYFAYLASRVLRDFGDLILSTILNDTPLLVINLLIILVVVYAIYLGIEALGKTGEIFFILLMATLILAIFFIFVSGLPKLENLQPVLEEGLKPVVAAAFPLILTFPFGEMIVFSMLLPYLNEPDQGIKTGLAAMILSGLILSSVMAINISVLGPESAANHLFPFFKTVSKINIANIIQRLDSMAIILLVIGGFFKIVIFSYAAVIGTADLFQIKKQQILVYLVCMIVLIASLWIANNSAEHLEIGLKIVPIYFHLPMQVGIPLILLILTFIRKQS